MGRQGSTSSMLHHMTHFSCSCQHRILVLALLFSTGVLLQLLGCVLWGNWWPMLTGIM